eukprot:CAMPEP_0115543044 /NCGR_PEP_ID=MMETSP0271-20121206/91336_1 /TAXON_ID=71861 /ORGANISM="Scrippsiella trochoidea, Strain CCMP3099" /LENGTH=88 /DNA_ID=CAMNT_0002976249 /DNA_START=107 /DNA_END=372 /DNA_ORIENTATION=-
MSTAFEALNLQVCKMRKACDSMYLGKAAVLALNHTTLGEQSVQFTEGGILNCGEWGVQEDVPELCFIGTAVVEDLILGWLEQNDLGRE